MIKVLENYINKFLENCHKPLKNLVFGQSGGGAIPRWD